ncbi:putative pectinesterase/pectinesterase inhibitor 26 [Asparagus officinalis]|uniref:putative pectinesterase/pectinesterase inhibitor 26 n=1 Tax=Asparagus officinalis TaxID=4686 RepID=UPI00098DFBF1|nr:putative pectinesterase/pectinesterase inhibitor 26 [Asparagus officinalis]
MDSFTSFPWQKSETEEREYHRKKRIRLIIIGVSTFLLLVIVIASSAVAIANKYDNGSNDNMSSTSRDSSVKAVCGVAQYPESCVSSISATQEANSTNDPKAIFELSLKISIEALLNLTSLSDSLSNLTEDKAIQDVLYNCREMFEDAIDRLNDSTQLLNQPLSSSHISTLRSWLSAAITDQVTCLDELENTTSSISDKMAEAMLNSTQFTSNSLAIVTKVVSHLQDLDIPFHRKLLTKGVPHWVSNYRRQRSELVFVIYVEGVYNEIVKADKNKWNVVMYGMYKTIVSGSLNRVDGYQDIASTSLAAANSRPSTVRTSTSSSTKSSLKKSTGTSWKQVMRVLPPLLTWREVGLGFVERVVEDVLESGIGFGDEMGVGAKSEQVMSGRGVSSDKQRKARGTNRRRMLRS